MVSWRGGLKTVIGSNAFLIAWLRDAGIVSVEASPESLLR